MKYLLGTGYHPNSRTPIATADFSDIWIDNVLKHTASSPPYEKLVVGHTIPIQYKDCGIDSIGLYAGDLGHIRDKHEGKNNHYVTGWAGAMLTAAMVAYCNVLDFVYQEQDCLAFGPYVEQLYKDMGDGKMTIGPALRPPHQRLTSAQSLFLVRHEYIPHFVKNYLTAGEDACCDGLFGEQKFTKLFHMDPFNVRISGNWILDRNRPITWDAPVWAAQQWTLEEFNEAKKGNLI